MVYGFYANFWQKSAKICVSQLFLETLAITKDSCNLRYPLFEIPHSYVIQARNGPGLIIHLDHVYKCGNIMTDRANLIDPYLSV